MPLDWHALMTDEKVLTMLAYRDPEGLIIGPTLFGVYLLLLHAAWFADVPASLPDNDQLLAAITRLDQSLWQRVKPHVLTPFDRLSDGRYHQKKLRQVYEAVVKKLRGNSEGGKKAMRNRWGTNDLTNQVITDLQDSYNNRTELEGTVHKLKSDSARRLENERIARCQTVLGAETMAEFGSIWRLRVRENWPKLERVLNAVEHDMKTTKVDNPGGHADDLWGRFAD